jgi:hypothetical protein
MSYGRFHKLYTTDKTKFFELFKKYEKRIISHYKAFHNKPGFTYLRSEPEDLAQTLRLSLHQTILAKENPNNSNHLFDSILSMNVYSNMKKLYKNDKRQPIPLPLDEPFYENLLEDHHTPTLFDDRGLVYKQQSDQFCMKFKKYIYKGTRKYISEDFKILIVALTLNEFVKFRVHQKNLAELAQVTPNKISLWRKKYMQKAISLVSELESFSLYRFYEHKNPTLSDPKYIQVYKPLAYKKTLLLSYLKVHPKILNQLRTNTYKPFFKEDQEDKCIQQYKLTQNHLLYMPIKQPKQHLSVLTKFSKIYHESSDYSEIDLTTYIKSNIEEPINLLLLIT